MYIPPHDAPANSQELIELIRAFPLGIWVTPTTPEPIVNHVPFMLKNAGSQHVLCCHVARANPVWTTFSHNADSVVIFRGPDAYISPNWYPSKHEHGKAVPTWNYVAAHAFGVPRVVDDAAWLLAHVTQLTQSQEQHVPNPWQVADAPREYIERMLAAIVGIEIPVRRLEGKWKISANRAAADREGVAMALRAQSNNSAQAMAKLVAAAATVESKSEPRG